MLHGFLRAVMLSLVEGILAEQFALAAGSITNLVHEHRE